MGHINLRIIPSVQPCKVVTDGKEVFLIHVETGMRIDVIDDDNIPAPEDVSRFVAEHVPQSEGGPTLSDESDMALTGMSEATTTKSKSTSGLDSRMAALLTEIGPDTLTREQMGTINQLRGAIATGRDRLFTTTSMMLDNHNENRLSHAELVSFRDEVADKLASMHQGISERHTQLNNCVAENIKILRDLGISEALLGDIVNTAAKARAASLKRPDLPLYEIPESTVVDEGSLAGAHTALAPRKSGESLEDFGRRAEATLARKTRAAAAFAPMKAPQDRPDVTSATQANPARPVTRFRVEDVGSISSAPRRPPFSTLFSGRPVTQGGNSLSHTGYLTANDANEQPGNIFEEFRKETDEGIARIVDKHLSRVLVVPSHVKPPKLDVPSKFSGVDDHLAFMRWVKRLASWMQAMFYGGSDDDVDEYRVAILKNLLDGVALEWYMDFVDDASASSELDFTSVLCELHRIFITTAMAHHAIRDFDAIRFKAEDGPLKLLDDLEACSRRMREPLPEVIIRQRSNRGTTAPRRPTPQTEQRPRSSPAPNTSASTTKNLSQRPLPAGLNPHADKNCYKCGGLGHIGSDPVCPKYGDQPTFKDRPRVGAQRVLDSYVAEDDGLEQEEEGMTPIHDGWGGSQYDSDPEPEVQGRGTDLQDLVEEAAEEARMGTICLQHFSLCVDAQDSDPQESAAELMVRLPPNLRPRGGYGSTARQDVMAINAHRAMQGLPPVSAAAEERMIRSLRGLHAYRDDLARGFAERFEEYEMRHGPVNWTPHAIDESDTLMLLQRAEDLRNVRQASSLTPLAFTPEFSSTELALMGVDQLADIMTEYVAGTRAVEALGDSLLGLNRLALNAMESLRRQRAAPRSSSSPTNEILDVAEAMLQRTLDHTTQFIRAADRRLEDRRVYTVRLRYEHSVRPDLLPLLEGPIEDPNSVPEFEPSESDDDLAAHDEQIICEMLTESSSSPPVAETPDETPPPSYPGTPESEGPVLVIDISSDEDMGSVGDDSRSDELSTGSEIDSLRLAAMRVDSDNDMPELEAVSDSEDELLDTESTLSTEPSSSRYQARINFLENPETSADTMPVGDASRLAEWRTNNTPRTRVTVDLRNTGGIPGFSNPPGNPDDPEDLGRLSWIYGLDRDNGNRFVSMHEFPPPGADHTNGPLNPTSFPTGDTLSPFQLIYGRATPAEGSAEEYSSPDEELEIVDHSRHAPEPGPNDECILRSVVMLTDSVAERFSTMVDAHGTVYVRTSPLPDNHYLSPEFHDAHPIREDPGLAAHYVNASVGEHPTQEPSPALPSRMEDGAELAGPSLSTDAGDTQDAQCNIKIQTKVPRMVEEDDKELGCGPILPLPDGCPHVLLSEDAFAEYLAHGPHRPLDADLADLPTLEDDWEDEDNSDDDWTTEDSRTADDESGSAPTLHFHCPTFPDRRV
ncbi:hypothetical protein DFH06DRAFT_1147149 [Mycena polygramma]|nr:hypothetical protein DFH06DRAFT_1147149 [Mycena polygramma]